MGDANSSRHEQREDERMRGSSVERRCSDSGRRKGSEEISRGEASKNFTE